MAEMELSIEPSGELEIVMTRRFRAPKALVFACWTDPRHLQRWLLGPPGNTMPVCEVDLRVGGSFRCVWRSAGGWEMSMTGIYQEISPPDRLVHIERFDEPWYPGECVITMKLEEEDGVTTMRSTLRYQTREARDMVLNSPMREGVAASYDRLEELMSSEALAGDR